MPTFSRALACLLMAGLCFYIAYEYGDWYYSFELGRNFIIATTFIAGVIGWRFWGQARPPGRFGIISMGRYSVAYVWCVVAITAAFSRVGKKLLELKYQNPIDVPMEIGSQFISSLGDLASPPLAVAVFGGGFAIGVIVHIAKRIVD